jgi:two-component system, NarL family, sensor histidine kinase DesK
MNLRVGRRPAAAAAQPAAPSESAAPAAAVPSDGDDVMVGALVNPKLARALADDEDEHRSGLSRALPLTGMLVIFLAAPLADVIQRHVSPVRIVFLAALMTAYLGLFSNLVLIRDRDLVGRPTPWARIVALTVFGLLLPVFSGPLWLTATGIVGACYAAYLPPRPALIGVLTTGAYCGVYAVAAHVDSGNALVFAFEPLVIGGFAYASGRRVELIRQLRATRGELARSAVADERLRISRDLHDLLGHSLSVIAVKAELARRMLPADPERAGREIGEVEATARRALQEVRDAVTGYRAPSLAVELVSARRAINAAGIRCLVDAPENHRLPKDVNALLAWAAREGATNVVRHSAATRCDIRLTVTATQATLELTDDGCAAGQDGTGREGTPDGHGLAGLAERTAALGGALEAGPRERGGYRLSVRVPVPPGAGGAA